MISKIHSGKPSRYYARIEKGHIDPMVSQASRNGRPRIVRANRVDQDT